MMKNLLIVCLFVTLGCSCNRVLNKKQAELKWREENVVVKETGCNGSDCAFADFRFVVFEGVGADSLNRQVQEMMGASFMDDSLIVASPLVAAQKFIAAFEANKKEFPDQNHRWMLDREMRPDTLFENVITLRYDESSFIGGAHGMYFTVFSHFQIAPFKPMWLADFLNNPADTLRLATIAEEIFRNKQELGKNEDLREAGYFFEQGIFRLNENFHFTAEGLEFHFNIYEIQPYAAGELELLIPYSKIAGLLKTEIFKTKPVS